MIRYIFISFVLLSLSSKNYAAVKWNNSESVKSKSDPKTYWNKTKYAKSCDGPEFEYFSDKISIKTIKIKDEVFENISYPLGLNSSNKCEFNYASRLVPKPLVDAKINSKYGGQDQKRFQPIYEFLNTNIGLNRFEPNGTAKDRLREFLLTWSSTDALSKNIRFNLMKKFRLDFHIQSLLPPMIIAFSDISLLGFFFSLLITIG